MTNKEIKWTSDFDFFTVHEHLTPFEYFKQCGGNLVNKNGKWFILPIESIRYKELAVAIYRNKNQIHIDKPEILEFYESIKEIFERAIEFIQWSRNIFDWSMCGSIEYPDIKFPLRWEIRFPWIMAGEEFIWFFNKMFVKYGWPDSLIKDNTKDNTTDYPYTKHGWPQNPGANVFDETGYSVLQAITNFASEVVVLYGRNQARIELLIDPKSWENVRLSKLDLSKKLHNYISANKWSDSEIEKEKERVLIMLKAEYQQALALQQLQVAVPKTENEGQWSKIMSKQEIVTAFGLTSVNKLNTLVKEGIYTIKPSGNRQSWQIQIDKLPSDIQKKLKP